MSAKKLLCNPPAEKIAASGDPEVEGLFIGAGKVLTGATLNRDQYLDYARKVVEIETSYMDARKRLAQETADSMHRVNYYLLKSLGDPLADAGGGGTGENYREKES